MKLMLFSFLFQMLGLSYFYGGFLVGPQVISCHVITNREFNCQGSVSTLRPVSLFLQI